MSKSFFLFILALLIVGCINRSNSIGCNDKHTESYIIQRIDSIYGRFTNPTYDMNGKRILNHRYNYDSVFCSSRYNALLNRADELSNDEDYLFDYDHWTNSQDPEDFTCNVGKIENITDSTATVVLNASNWGEKYTVTLCLYYEKDNWYVDDFISKYGFKSEKEYLRDYIRRHTDK